MLEIRLRAFWAANRVVPGLPSMVVNLAPIYLVLVNEFLPGNLFFFMSPLTDHLEEQNCLLRGAGRLQGE